MNRSKRHWRGIAALLVLIMPCWSAAQNIPTPEDYFGFRMGTDSELARWPKIVEYFKLLDAQSDCLTVQNLGETTLGNPFLLAIFSAPENLGNLEKYRQISQKLADPRGLSDTEIRKLIQTGKFVCCQSYSLHSTEVAGTQCTPELAYELVTSNDPTIRMILENTIFLMIPCFNPDGQIMVSDWFYKYKGTEYNNTNLPYLYHFYTGHDNNRDGFQLTQDETRLFAKVVYRDWIPQAFADHHQFGSSGARFYLPPYVDPIHPNVDPLIWREHQLYGAHMAVALDQAGKSGFENGVSFAGWVQALFNNTTNYHNICGMLTESASADWANPVYIMPDQLGGSRGRYGYIPQNSMPRLWPGGWWRLRDLVEQMMIASKATLELGARYREGMLLNMVRKAQGNIDRGVNGPPYAYIVPKDQHDFLTATKLVRIFQENGVEVHRLNGSYQSGSRLFAAGSYVFSCAQPMRVFIISFLEQVNYPDNAWTRSHGDQSPMRPYDLAEFNMAEQMGVDAIPILEPLRDINMSVVSTFIDPPAGSVHGSGNAYLFDHKSNESLRAVNRLHAKGYQIEWIRQAFDHAGHHFAPGAMIVRGTSGLTGEVQELALDLGLDFWTAPSRIEGGVYKLKTPKLGLYKRYAGGTSEEGWTNWLLKDFEFNHVSLFNKEMRSAKALKQYDVIIIPSDRYDRIVTGNASETVPPEYRGGIEKAGLTNLKQFVENGGTLITLNQAYELPQKIFDLPVRNTVDGVDRKEFFCPGSTVHIDVDVTHPVCYGMPARALGLYRRSPVLRVGAGDFKDGVSAPVRYAEENILQSGWLIGEKYLSKKPYVVEYKVGKGKVILLTTPVQHRAQMHGNFKLLFNSIFYGAAEIE